MADETTTISITDSSVPEPAAQKTADTPASDPAPLTEEQQKRFNKLVSNEKKMAAEKSLTALAEELGYGSVDEMKAAAKETRERKESEKTELQKMQERLVAVEKERDTEKQRGVEIESKRINSIVNDRIRSLAKNVEYPDDVVKHIRDNYSSELEGIVNEKDDVDDKVLTTLIDKVKASRPSWFSTGNPGSPSHRAAQTGHQNHDTSGKGFADTLKQIKRGGW